MDPIPAAAATNGLRPPPSVLQPDLSQVMRDGRVVLATIMESDTPGTLSLAIGRHRVAVVSDVRFELGQQILAQVAQGPDGIILNLLSQIGAGEIPLLGALRSVIGDDRPVGQLLKELANRLRAGLPQAGKDSGALTDLLTKLENELLDSATDGDALRKALQGSALRHEAALLKAANEGADPAVFAHLATSFKGSLIGMHETLPEGSLREAIHHALAGLEAEQLLNAARQESGDALIWSFPYSDGSAWTTVRLAIHEREQGSGEEEEEESAQRLVLGVSFSQLGPIRVDILRAKDRTSVRLLVERDDIAERLTRDSEQIAKLLGDGKREIAITARLGSSEELALEVQARDVPYLRDHHVLDLAG